MFWFWPQGDLDGGECICMYKTEKQSELSRMIYLHRECICRDSTRLGQEHGLSMAGAKQNFYLNRLECGRGFLCDCR